MDNTIKLFLCIEAVIPIESIKQTFDVVGARFFALIREHLVTMEIISLQLF